MDRIETANTLRRVAFAVDQRTTDRLTWASEVAKDKLGLHVQPSVILRAALAHYVRALSGMLEADNDASRRAERWELRTAAAGNREPLHPEALHAIPPRPFRLIEHDNRPPASPLLSQPFDLEADYRPGEGVTRPRPEECGPALRAYLASRERRARR